MGLFKLFGNKEKNTVISKGFYELRISEIQRLSKSAVKISFEVPEQVKSIFSFLPGQYLTFELFLNNEKIRRSYSICSAPNEILSVAVKAVEKGKASNWFNTEAKVGDLISVAKPEGNFTIDTSENKIVAIAAGSGITPIVSIAKSLSNDTEMHLFYGNKSEEDALFLDDLKNLAQLKMTNFLSREEKVGFSSGRIDKTTFTEIIKADLDLLKSSIFYICGPEQMIMDIQETLLFFGVADKKIKFELFTTPVLAKITEPASSFSGTSKVTIIIDGESECFDIKAGGTTILDTAEKNGMDAPYSCRGGVCCSCKAKILEGTASMRLNYSLTEEEIQNGYILTCQAHPTSETLIVSYDE